MPLRAVVLLALCAVSAFAQSGDWVATVSFGPAKLRVTLHITSRPGGAFAATADCVDQDAFALPVTRFQVAAGRLRFAVPRLGGRFTGSLAKDGQTIEGQWTQRQGSFPMRFERGNIRPQEPAPPYPYNLEEVVCRNGRVRLAGTLTVPRTAGPHPAVLLITGSGPQDRNDTTSGHRPFLVWADYLTRRGFAVLRLDDRGVGGSTGKLLDSTDEDFASDALAAVAWLRARSDIDPRRIGLLGHSEGAAVAPLAAARSRDIAFLVLLAGPAVPGERILFAQSERISQAMGVPEDVARRNRQVQSELFAIARRENGGSSERRAIESLLAAEAARSSPEEAAVIRGQAGSQIDVAASRWFRFVLDYDPRPVIEKLSCPVLALYGSLDVQVPADLNAPEMERALAGNPRHQVLTLPGLNHMLQNAATGSPVEYTQIEETVAPQVLQLVGEWLELTPTAR